jgi:hypothetical protein
MLSFAVPCPGGVALVGWVWKDQSVAYTVDDGVLHYERKARIRCRRVVIVRVCCTRPAMLTGFRRLPVLIVVVASAAIGATGHVIVHCRSILPNWASFTSGSFRKWV